MLSKPQKMTPNHSPTMKQYWGIILLMIGMTLGHRELGPTGWDIVDFNDKYYYLNLVHKMDESLSVSNCTISTEGERNQFPRRLAPASRENADLTLKILPPTEDVLEEWKNLKHSLEESHHHHATARQFVKVDPSLCKSKEFAIYSRGMFRRAKGCYKMYITDPKTGRRKKRINTYGATLHPDHSRCNIQAAIDLCKHALNGEDAMDYPWEIEVETPIAHTQYPFMVKSKDVIVAKSGMFSLPCGPFGLYSSCEATNWGLPAARLHIKNVTQCRQDPEYCKVPTFDKIFVGSQYDDTQIGQFMTEDLPKIVYNLDFIKANPDMKIHFGFTKRDVLPTYVLPHNIFNWLGLGDRLINGSFFAKEAYMPREGGCQEPGYAMWEIYNMRKVFLQKAKEEIGVMGRNHSQGWGYPTFSLPDESFGPMDFTQSEEDLHKPVVLLLKRSSSRFTQNQGDFKERRWPPEMGGAGAVRDALAKEFPHHRIMIFSDKDKDMMLCMACQAQIFNNAEVVVGVHGAGLTNSVFMNPGGIMVEAVPHYDSRHAPVTGIFARLAGMNGLSHYSFDLRTNFSPEHLARETRSFYDVVKEGQPRTMPKEHMGDHHAQGQASSDRT